MKKIEIYNEAAKEEVKKQFVEEIQYKCEANGIPVRLLFGQNWKGVSNSYIGEITFKILGDGMGDVIFVEHLPEVINEDEWGFFEGLCKRIVEHSSVYDEPGGIMLAKDSYVQFFDYEFMSSLQKQSFSNTLVLEIYWMKSILQSELVAPATVYSTNTKMLSDVAMIEELGLKMVEFFKSEKISSNYKVVTKPFFGIKLACYRGYMKCVVDVFYDKSRNVMQLTSERFQLYAESSVEDLLSAYEEMAKEIIDIAKIEFLLSPQYNVIFFELKKSINEIENVQMQQCAVRLGDFIRRWQLLIESLGIDVIDMMEAFEGFNSDNLKRISVNASKVSEQDYFIFKIHTYLFKFKFKQDKILELSFINE